MISPPTAIAAFEGAAMTSVRISGRDRRTSADEVTATGGMTAASSTSGADREGDGTGSGRIRVSWTPTGVDRRGRTATDADIRFSSL
jgi:hypothetical protein